MSQVDTEKKEVGGELVLDKSTNRFKIKPGPSGKKASVNVALAPYEFHQVDFNQLSF